MKTVVIIPTYNERTNIKELVPEIFRQYPDLYIMVVDDSSPDNTAGAVKDMQKEYANLSLLLRPKKEGLGKAYIDAFNEVLANSNVESVIMMDADFSHDPIYLSKMIEESANYELVIGSRYIEGGATVGWEWWRVMLSKMGNFYCSLILGMPINDFTGGFNLIKTRALKEIDLSKLDLVGYVFSVNIKYLLYRNGNSFIEIPIVFKNRVEGKSKMSGSIIKEALIAPWKMRMGK